MMPLFSWSLNYCHKACLTTKLAFIWCSLDEICPLNLSDFNNGLEVGLDSCMISSNALYFISAVGADVKPAHCGTSLCLEATQRGVWASQ